MQKQAKLQYSVNMLGQKIGVAPPQQARAPQAGNAAAGAAAGRVRSRWATMNDARWPRGGQAAAPRAAAHRRRRRRRRERGGGAPPIRAGARAAGRAHGVDRGAPRRRRGGGRAVRRATPRSAAAMAASAAAAEAAARGLRSTARPRRSRRRGARRTTSRARSAAARPPEELRRRALRLRAHPRLRPKGRASSCAPTCRSHRPTGTRRWADRSSVLRLRLLKNASAPCRKSPPRRRLQRRGASTQPRRRILTATPSTRARHPSMRSSGRWWRASPPERRASRYPPNVGWTVCP